MKVTRRKLAGMLAAVPLAAQPAAEDENLKSARDQMRAQAKKLADVKLPMTTEPPFHFKA